MVTFIGAPRQNFVVDQIRFSILFLPFPLSLSFFSPFLIPFPSPFCPPRGIGKKALKYSYMGLGVAVPYPNRVWSGAQAESECGAFLLYNLTSGGTNFTIFTARCTMVQSAVLRLHVVCPSVRLSLTLVDQDNIGWKS